MTQQQLTRRRILATVATAGALGAVGGSGARALLSDTETIPAALSADALDLTVCLDDGTDCRPVDPGDIDLAVDLDTEPTGSARLEIALAADAENTPGYVWLRTNCPDGTCGIEQALDVTVRLDHGCDGHADPDDGLLAAGSLCSVRSTLGPGRLLSTEPLVPGERLCIEIAWELGTVCEDDTVALDVELFAHQAAHSGGPRRPWSRDCVATCKSAADCDCSLPGISFVAFCVPDGTALAPEHVAFEWRANAEGEPVSIDWTATVDLETVVLYYGAPGGPVFENFPGGPGGVATVGDGLARLDGQSPPHPAPTGQTGLKYEFDDGDFDVAMDDSGDAHSTGGVGS